MQPAIQATALSVIENLSADAEVKEVISALELALPLMYSASSQDFQRTLEAVDVLRAQPAAVEALVRRYQGLSVTDYSQRMFTVQILGELRRDDALPHLETVVWTVLPEKTNMSEGLTPRDFEEMIQVQAVKGIAYQRGEQSDAAVIQVLQKHEARAVRIAAIDAFMWNKNDDKEVGNRLYELLPEDLHPYVEMPRVYRGMDVEDFKRRLAAWRKRWGEDGP